jgi:saccharopine dehydrogenase (NAD+, L-glutamate forming)
MAQGRRFDLILFGATGFTGGLVTDYLAQASAREPLRWAIAGRDAGRLAQVRAQVAAVAGAIVPEVLTADVGDPAAMTALAAATTAVITTVGPYARYGEPLLRACAENGTHYTDLTGEPQFVHRMREKYDAVAKRSGARIVNSCGFESIPPDITVLLAVTELRRRLGAAAFASADVVVKGGAEGGGGFSGGTWHSAVEAMASAREWWFRRPAEPQDGVHAVTTPLFHESHWQRWAVLMPTIDPEVVRHSARVRGDYGHTFSYGHYLVMKNPLALAGLVAGVGGVFTLAQFGPTRRWLLGRRLPGDGPSAEQRDRGWFNMHVTASAGGVTVVAKMSGGDPGYGDTAKMLAEAGLCLALDGGLPEAAGVITPASAMGAALLPRLKRAGLHMDLR